MERGNAQVDVKSTTSWLIFVRTKNEWIHLLHALLLVLFPQKDEWNSLFEWGEDKISHVTAECCPRITVSHAAFNNFQHSYIMQLSLQLSVLRKLHQFIRRYLNSRNWWVSFCHWNTSEESCPSGVSRVHLVKALGLTSPEPSLSDAEQPSGAVMHLTWKADLKEHFHLYQLSCC